MINISIQVKDVTVQFNVQLEKLLVFQSRYKKICKVEFSKYILKILYLLNNTINWVNYINCKSVIINNLHYTNIWLKCL